MNAQDRRRARRAAARAKAAPAFTETQAAEFAALLAAAEGAPGEELAGNGNDIPSDSAVCAVCDHPGGTHEGEDNLGACSAAGCDCEGFNFAEQLSITYTIATGTNGKQITSVTDTSGNAWTESSFTMTFDAEPPLIDAHQPQSRIPRRHPAAKAPGVGEQPTRSNQAAVAQWVATLAPEASLTDDGRVFAPDSISWRDLPLTLMGLTGTSAEGGHDGAEVAGRIDKIWREGGLIRGSGVFDTSEFGQEIARMVADGTMRGISVDLAIHKFDFGPKTDWFNEAGEWAPVEQTEEAPSMVDLLFGPDKDADNIFVVTDATIGMATACPFQAFREATIEPASSLVAAPHDAMWTFTDDASWRLKITSPGTSDGSGIMDGCTCHRNALIVNENSLRAAAAVIAKLAMSTDASKELCPQHSVLNADALSLERELHAESESALIASLTATDASQRSDTKVSPPKKDSRNDTNKPSARENGSKQTKGKSTSGSPHGEDTQESKSNGTNSAASWSSKETSAPSASTQSITTRIEDQSRIPVLTTNQGRSLFADGSVTHAIAVLAASAMTQTDFNAQPSTFVAPVSPPKEWFSHEPERSVAPLTVDDEGRIFGYAATWSQCHVAFPDTCVLAPHSQTDYAYYLMGEVVCDDGERVPVGTITLGTGHAGAGLGMSAATSHYDHTGTGVADVTVGEDEHGIWVAGAVRSDVTDETLRVLRAAKLSGDWRNIDGNLELCALLAVNVPGFPIPRPRASIVASGDEAQMVMSLTAAGIPTDSDLQAAFDALAAQASGEFAELAARAAAV